MFRNLFLALTILAITSLSLLSFAQGANDPLLRRQTQSEKRIKTSSGGPHSTVPPSIPRAKANGVDAQLNQIERQTIKSQGPTVHRSAYPAPKTANTRAENQPMNFQYHAPKTVTTSQPAGGSGGASKPSGIHRVR